MAYHEPHYETSCEKSHVFFESNCKSNNFKFCPYCGGHIVIVEVNEE